MNAKRSWDSGRWDAVRVRECVPVTTHLNPSVALFKGLSTHTRKKSRVYQTGETGGRGGREQELIGTMVGEVDGGGGRRGNCQAVWASKEEGEGDRDEAKLELLNLTN